MSRVLAEQTLASFLARTDRSGVEVTPQLQLVGEGLGLDSLELAELSALLEDELGSDPFSQGEMPQTVGELLDFYGTAPAAV